MGEHAFPFPTPPPPQSKERLPLFHRDLSWLQFNGRVLEEAEDRKNPLTERIKFLAISSSNLDECYMVRISSMERAISLRQRRNDEEEVSRLIEVREELYREIPRFLTRQRKVLEGLTRELSEIGIELVSEGSPLLRSTLSRKVFEEQVLSKLPPPENFSIERLSELGNLEAAALCKGNMWVRIPREIPTFLIEESREGQPNTFCFFLDHLLRMHLMVENGESRVQGIVRLTRGADEKIDLTNSDSEFIPDAVLSSIKNRDRGMAVRLQINGIFEDAFIEAVQTALKLTPQQVIRGTSSVFYHGLWKLVQQAPKALIEQQKSWPTPLVPHIPKPFRSKDKIFLGLRQKDYLLHHPYDSFDAYVALINAACHDEQVTKIEQTIYRMDAVSPVVSLLKQFASKKDIRVVIELRARFDEMNNLRLASELRNAGVKVTFGSGQLKIHAKVALITRNEEDGVRLYTHLSTGNYNLLTARVYTDLGLVTADPDIGADVRQFFDSLYSGEAPRSFKKIVIAPQFLARRIQAHIRDEIEAAKAGRPARIFAKVNALVDEKIIEALYEASKAGVKIDLVVRGACSLIPGLPHVSENIRVVSIVDRYLEHSRIYYFESSSKMYLSSADWMPRNFFSRLEIAFPVLDPRVFAYLKDVIIPAYLRDTERGRVLSSSGEWSKPTPQEGKEYLLRAQQFFEKLALEDYRGTPLEWKKTDSLPPRPPK